MPAQISLPPSPPTGVPEPIWVVATQWISLPGLAALSGLLGLVLLSRWLAPEIRHWLDAPPRPILAPTGLWALLSAGLSLVLVAAAQQGPVMPTVWQAVAMGVWSASLLLAAVIDLRARLLPDRMTWLLSLVGLVLAGFGQFISLGEALVGGLLGYAIPWATNSWAIRYRGVKSMAIGRGDMALLAAIGLWLGPTGLAWVLFASSLLLLLVVAGFELFSRLRPAYPRTKGHRLTALPMGPAIAVCAWLGPAGLLHESNLIDWLSIVADFAA
jgi:prepilin signal peptidase PulO-like enzyme (type II secretory pathway)